MDFTLSKEHEMLRKMYREFAETEVKPLAAGNRRGRALPQRDDSQAGHVTASWVSTFPKKYGGQPAATISSYAMCR